MNPDDTLQIFTSPYRRTRETTEGILKTLTARNDPDDPDAAPSPFSRSKITVYEEPRLREQDFGNFQPCSAEMERMWAERADYGHFFYRIPNGESAADAYDRISGFNESLWRQCGDRDFPSVCVLVTHGLMTRVFLMKWYHWSVEYFEDLRNVNHCEFVVMRRREENGKYALENQMRTWSELKRQKALEAEAEAAKEERREETPTPGPQPQPQQRDREPRPRLQDPTRRNTLSAFLKQDQPSPSLPPRKWGGCAGGCNHDHDRYPRRKVAQEQAERANALPAVSLPPAMEGLPGDGTSSEARPMRETTTAPLEGSTDGSTDPSPDSSRPHTIKLPHRPSPASRTPSIPSVPHYLHPGRDGGGSSSGTNTPHEVSDEEEYFHRHGPFGHHSGNGGVRPKSLAKALRRPQRKPTEEDIERWTQESGMGRGKQADALGTSRPRKAGSWMMKGARRSPGGTSNVRGRGSWRRRRGGIGV